MRIGTAHGTKTIGAAISTMGTGTVSGMSLMGTAIPTTIEIGAVNGTTATGTTSTVALTEKIYLEVSPRI